MRISPEAAIRCRNGVIQKELREAGVCVCEDYSDVIEGVVMGYDTELTYKSWTTFQDF